MQWVKSLLVVDYAKSSVKNWLGVESYAVVCLFVLVWCDVRAFELI